MSAQHTPGPWIWADDYKGLFGAGPDNEVISYYHHEGMHMMSHRSPANARLIAAAPELLEALIGLMERESRGRIMPIGKEWDAARAAIAKAEVQS